MISSHHICILSTVHKPFDSRIFHRQAKTLVDAGYNVTLIAQHDANEIVDGIRVISLPRAKSRLHRMIVLSFKVFKLALRQNAVLYHLHDPELLFVGVLLKIDGRKVIYDVHEDYEQKIMSKTWIRKVIRKPISHFMWKLEEYSSKILDYIVTADSHTMMKFNTKKAETIANYPPLSFISESDRTYQGEVFKVIYVGGITEDRGLHEMVEAVKYSRHTDVELHLAGSLEKEEFLNIIAESNMIRYHGELPWPEVSRLLLEADIGLILLQPVSAYLYCPGENIIKLFEYMMAGLPVIISDFPQLSEFVLKNGFGISVDPTSPRKIAEAIDYLYDNSDLRRQMGRNGRAAVLCKYNWEIEGQKLLRIYDKILR
jgi:glycosyltransferase involved in cell wall biosynthesis